jgi:hypothetical protein
MSERAVAQTVQATPSAKSTDKPATSSPTRARRLAAGTERMAKAKAGRKA